MAVEWTLEQDGRVLRVHGSNDLQDWVRNFRTRRVGRVFEARVNRWDRAEAIQVLRETRDYRDDIQVVIGHSRGGAIAQIVAYELSADSDHDVYLHTYGSKRTGNRIFVEQLWHSVWWTNVRNRGDIVPYLPPWYAGYRSTLIGNRTWRPLWIAHTDYRV